MDWTDKTRKDRFVYEMVDPFDLDSSRGYLDNVVAGSPQITQGYYTDTRISASLEVADHNYVDYSLIRIHHYVDEENYHKELGTFFVASRSRTDNQTNKESFEMTSMLDRISDDVLTSNYTIAKNKTAQDVLKDLFNRYSVPYTIQSGSKNKTYTSTTVYEVGSSVLSTVFDISSDAGLRIDLDGHGRVLVSNYIEPKSKTPIFDFNFQNGSIIGEVTKTNNPFDATNRVLVVASQNDSKAMGYADVESSSKISYSRLGRRNTSVNQISNLSPFSNTGATNKAKSLIKDYEQDPAEYTFQGLYFPANVGDTVTIALRDGKQVKAMIKNRDFDLSSGMVCSYTLKEV